MIDFFAVDYFYEQKLRYDFHFYELISMDKVVYLIWVGDFFLVADLTNDKKSFY
jgi:hypothetical protein